MLFSQFDLVLLSDFVEKKKINMSLFAQKLSRCKLCCNTTPQIKLLWFVRGDHLRICKVCKRCFLNHRLSRLQTPLFASIIFEMMHNPSSFYSFEPCVLNHLSNLRQFVRTVATMNKVRRFGIFLSCSSHTCVNKSDIRWFLEKKMLYTSIRDSYPYVYQAKPC